MTKIEKARAWALSRVGNPYLMGGTGQPCTVSYRRARATQYPGSAAKIEANCPRMGGGETSCKGCRYYDESTGTGKRAYDCAQLTRWCMDAVGVKLVSGATSQWNKTDWAQRGEISSLPSDQLCLVFRRDNPKTMGHVGLYLGDGTVVHAKGHDYGVVREGLSEYGRFTHWGIPAGLYEPGTAAAPPEPEKPGEPDKITLTITRATAETLAAALEKATEGEKESA